MPVTMAVEQSWDGLFRPEAHFMLCCSDSTVASKSTTWRSRHSQRLATRLTFLLFQALCAGTKALRVLPSFLHARHSRQAWWLLDVHGNPLQVTPETYTRALFNHQCLPGGLMSACSLLRSHRVGTGAAQASPWPLFRILQAVAWLLASPQ